ncbi:hypothetical protein LTR36_005427 [Oleoguttula mirabilis]|uniref:Uncharacterized protein n=1 Tax=Oleoguttula mirabilis TaxID=1507867 RepID=A0AAV9JEQ0_9PEZI|nr:hypothetical protein LTR36_005427 [Oleoguttula mirabilis]
MRRLEARRQMEEANFLSSKARSQNLNPPIDLRMLDYVTAYDDNLMCPICRCPFLDPVVLAECDHCFCRDCIRQTWASTYSPLGPRGDCPSCRTPAKLGPRSATSKILVNITDDLLVRCPKSEDGCKAQVKRGEVQDHVNIYCGYAYMECTADDCELHVLRKDAAEGCLHFGVSCLDCRQSMQKASLETHWRVQCPDRKVSCELCKEAVFNREWDTHSRETCPAISIPCPGKVFGCNSRSKRSQADVHAKSCTFAKLTPMLTAMQQRMDEQEAAQKVMVRKLEVLEGGFQAVQTILSTKQEDPDQVGADESRIPLLTGRPHQRGDSGGMLDAMVVETDVGAFVFPPPSSSSRPSSELVHVRAGASLPPLYSAPMAPGPRPADLPEPFTMDFDMASPFPPPAANGPYISPLHHLLSMHESLRDEMSRMSAALQELDGRQSMQALNENLRTREEISYMAAQVAGLSRQVHWLTSAQLQRQQHGGAGRQAAGAAGPSGSDIAGAGAGVEAAVSTAASALRGAARIVNAGQGMTMRRGLSEEGRTKL